MTQGAFLTSALWGPVGLVVGVLFTIVMGWWFWRARTHLYYSMSLATPLLNVSPAVRERLVLPVGEVPLDHPHHVEVELISRGPRDIAPGDFHGALTFDIGAVVIDMIGEPRVVPTSAQIPRVSHSGSTISVQPCLIKSRERISVSLLVDGAHPHLTSTSAHLANVDPKSFTGEVPPIGPWRKATRWAGGAALVYNLLIGPVVASFVPGASEKDSPLLQVGVALIWTWLFLAVFTALLKRVFGRF
ncbi:hypothetical protein ACXNSR_38990 (plasmid) [Streptomyces sp. NC-S4]